MSLNEASTETFGRADLAAGDDGLAGLRGRRGVGAATRRATRSAGADLVLSSDVPIGAGLSSSAALECATLATLADLNELVIEPLDRAKLARRCENEFVGAPTGLMDQAASTLCVDGHALFFDCRSFDFRAGAGRPGRGRAWNCSCWTPTPRTPWSTASTPTRRATCEEAAALLGVPALRDVDRPRRRPAALPDEVMRRRVRHVVTENARVTEAADLLIAGRLADLAPAAGRLARLHARRLRDHRADRGPGRRGGPRRRARSGPG